MRSPGSVQTISSTVLLSLRDYWLAIKGDRPLPERSDLEPSDIPRLLPYLALTEVHHQPLRFRYRLVGTRITEMAGRDATGRWLDEDLYGDNTDRMLWAFRRCVSEKSPVAVREQVQFADKEWIIVEVLMLPLGRPDREIELILSAVDNIDTSVEKPGSDSRFILDWQN
jgi:hypothetical protein